MMVLQSLQVFPRTPQPDPAQAEPAQSPLAKVSGSAVDDEKGGQNTDTKSQVKYDSMCVKVRCVVTKLGLEGEVRVRVAPRGICLYRHVLWYTVADLRRDVIILTSQKKPNLDAVRPFLRDVIPTAPKVERETETCVGRSGVRVGKHDPTPCVVFDCRVAIRSCDIPITKFSIIVKNSIDREANPTHAGVGASARGASCNLS